MTSIKTLAIATLPVLALLAFPQAASARGSGFVSFKSNTFSNNLHVNNTNGGVNTNLIQLPPPPPPATALPKRRNSPRPM
jgi:hypothetical protein